MKQRETTNHNATMAILSRHFIVDEDKSKTQTCDLSETQTCDVYVVSPERLHLGRRDRTPDGYCWNKTDWQ